jgi:hypothetical protein
MFSHHASWHVHVGTFALRKKPRYLSLPGFFPAEPCLLNFAWSKVSLEWASKHTLGIKTFIQQDQTLLIRRQGRGGEPRMHLEIIVPMPYSVLVTPLVMRYIYQP